MFFRLLILPLVLCTLTCLAAAQSRDYLTPEEIELVRDAQEIDYRIDVLVKAADRRFAVLGIDVQPPVIKKETGEWGKPPSGTRAELLDDIRRILQKAVDDLDSLAERPDSAILPHPDDPKRKNRGLNDIFPIAVRSLAAGSQRFKVGLERELERATDRAERGLISTSIDLSSQIIEASAKIPNLKPKSKN